MDEVWDFAMNRIATMTDEEIEDVFRTYGGAE